MVEKIKSSKNPPVFGSSVKRFHTLGLHPELTTVNASNPLGPGQYHPHPFECKYKNNASWTQKLESEEWSKFLGFRLPQLLAQRQFARTLGGPGTLDPYEYESKKGASTFKNVGFSTSKRFPNFYKDEKLPPGVHNVKEHKTKFNDLPSFEWSGFGSRFKTSEPKYRLAPNRYSLPHRSIVDKVVSKRGPYDTFTGPRDNTTIKNHFAPALFKPPDTIYPIPNALDHLLYHPSKQRCGRFFQSLRFPPGANIKATKNGFSMYEKDPHYPSPAEYDLPQGISKAAETMYPFNSSNKNARPPPNWKIHPGPDRYFVKYPKCHKKGMKRSWMFLSTAKRGLEPVESYSNFIYS